MFNVNFCKPVRKRFVNDLKRIQREIVEEQVRLQREGSKPFKKQRPYNSELADTMLVEGDLEGLANEVARPNKP